MRPRDVFPVILCIGWLAACDSKKTSDDVVQDSSALVGESGEAADKKLIERMLKETIARLKYGDKSALYENEFEYFTDEKTYDDYLEKAEIRWAQADTVTLIEVKHIDLFDRDSALVDVTVHFEGPTGKKSYLDDRLYVYYHKGRWIKPTVTVIDLQLNYEEKIRIADSAAAAEAAEQESK